jgi:hypothetical protein
MARLDHRKLHIGFDTDTTPLGPVTPRRYTLTHSDRTGELFLTVGADYDRKQISGWYTRLMRDEVLAEWQVEHGNPELHVHCHVSGGLIFGSANWRFSIFRHELPLVLEAIRHGDRALFENQELLGKAPIWVHFHASDSQYDRVEDWGTPDDYDSQDGAPA